MKKLMAFLSFGVFLLNTAGAQDLFLGGKIPTTPFFGKLTSQDGDVTGRFVLESTGKTLEVVGRLESNGKLVLKEKGEDSKTLWRFEGQMSGQRLKGRWVDGAGSVSADGVLLASTGKKSLQLPERIHMEQDVISFTKELAGGISLNPVLYQWLAAVWSDFWTEWEAADPELGLPSFDFYHHLEKSYMSDSLVSMVFTQFSYTGGAHGIGIFQSQNFQRVEGLWKPLELANLINIPGGGAAALIKLILKDLKSQGASGVLEGSVKDLTLKQLERFYAGPEGLIFHFDPYELGPYAQGSFEVKLPWFQLKALLLPGALKRLLPAFMGG